VSRPERSGGRVTATAEEGRHACVAPTRGKGRPGLPVSDEGGVRQLDGRTNEQASGASAGSCGRDADCVKPAIRCVRAKRGRSGSGQRKERPEGRGSHRVARVCRRPEAQNDVHADERSVRVFMRSRSRPQRPRTGSPNVVRSAGTGERGSTKCRRDGPVAAQRSSGACRRQEGVILISPVPGASKRSEVAPGTGRLQRTKPEGRGGHSEACVRRWPGG